MAWQDRYIENLVIITGDNTQFTLFTLPSFTKEIEYNGTQFSFVEINGELVKKNTIKGRSFPLEFYFIGDNHIDDATAFEKSAADPRPWKIIHPYYDNLLVQVLSLKFDDTDGNVTKITCTARETIQDNGAAFTGAVLISPVDRITQLTSQFDNLITTEPIATPSLTDIQQTKALTEKNYKEGLKIIQNPLDAQGYFNAVNTATSALDTIVATPELAMQALINVITLPAQFEANVKDRINILVNQFNNLLLVLFGAPTVANKQLVQAQGAAILSAMAQAASTPLPGNYTNANNALGISSIIQSTYTKFVAQMDNLQDPNGGNPLYFTPNFNIMIALNSLINFTTASLFDIALAGRKQFLFVLTEDSNIILLTHRFYKLDKLDANIDEFINNNNLAYREIMFGLQKGREVVYYA